MQTLFYHSRQRSIYPMALICIILCSLTIASLLRKHDSKCQATNQSAILESFSILKSNYLSTNAFENLGKNVKCKKKSIVFKTKWVNELTNPTLLNVPPPLSYVPEESFLFPSYICWCLIVIYIYIYTSYHQLINPPTVGTNICLPIIVGQFRG